MFLTFLTTDFISGSNARDGLDLDAFDGLGLDAFVGLDRISSLAMGWFSNADYELDSKACVGLDSNTGSFCFVCLFLIFRGARPHP